MVFLRTLVIGVVLFSATPARCNPSEPTPSLAHNNTIAIAVPLTDIQIDGDLADWPSDLPIYKLRERKYLISPIDANGALLDTSADCSPHFRVGYNLQDQAIYVAIETRDDTLFEEDASLVYLHTTLDPDQEPVRYYREYHSEDPEVSNIGFFDDLLFSQESLAESGVRSAVGRVGDVTVYEWAFKLSPSDLENIATNSDTRILFDVGVEDVDNDEEIDDEFQISWSPIPDKNYDGALLGCLTFATERSQLVQLQGTLVGEDGTPLPGLKIRVEDTEGSWKNEITTGIEGLISAWSPPGDLQVTVRGLAAADTVHLTTVSGTQPVVQLIAPHFTSEVRPILVSARLQREQQYFLLTGARYKIGDNPSWAADDFDDSDWNAIKSDVDQSYVPDASRVVWIRQRIIADEETASKAVVLEQDYTVSDSCSFWLNGLQVQNIKPYMLSQVNVRTTTTLGHMKPDLLAIRYVFSGGLNRYGYVKVLNFWVKEANSHFQFLIDFARSSNAHSILFTVLPLILFSVHLLTYFYYREQREHLYFALSMFAFAFAQIVVMGRELGINWLFSRYASFFSMQLVAYGLLGFLKIIFNQIDTRLSQLYKGVNFSLIIISGGFVVSVPLTLYDPFDIEGLYQTRNNLYLHAIMPIAFAIGLYAWVGRNKKPPGLNRLTSWSFGIYSAALLCCLYTLEFDIFNSLLLCGCAAGFIVALDIVIRSLRKRMPGSVILFSGVLVSVGVVSINFWFEFSDSEYFSYWFYSLGNIALILSLSCQLARIVGNTGRSLQIELERVETLSQTNLEHERALRQRMEDELEEAHQLQISMLPDHIPEHPSAEVNWSMKTATEVGGDYYDYRITDDDRLTLVLGDATGHGMQAGTLVTATKSLFQSLTTEGNLADTVSKMSVNLKSMNLHRLGMALTLVELDGRRLRYCAAGIPPILIYRAQEDTVEEGETGGLPLGLTTRGNYHQTELTLESGDALLLMSDGLAERTNEAEEEFGYQRVQDLFHEVATDTPAEICRKMAAGGDAWAAGKEQDDDVSFLAVRLR